MRWASSELANGAVICVPWAGAGAAPFRAWASLCPRDLELWAVRLPGRESRISEPLPTTIRLLARDLSERIAAAVALPPVLFGVCSGALIALELARSLRRDEAIKVQAVLVASPPKLGGHDGAVSPAPNALRDLLVAEGLLSAAIAENDELFALLRPAIEGDFALARHYEPERRPLVDDPIVAFIANGASSATAAAQWRSTTSAAFREIRLAGDHLFTGPAWEVLARVVFESASRAIEEGARA